MTTIKIELPDATAQAALDAGLLTSQALERLLNDALRRKAVDELFEKMDELADANFPPMKMERSRRRSTPYALAARADLIVSGDKHLHSLGAEYNGIPIVTPAQAVQKITG